MTARDEISKTMALLFKGVHELRVLHTGRSGISSGYFSNRRRPPSGRANIQRIRR